MKLKTILIVLIALMFLTTGLFNVAFTESALTEETKLAHEQKNSLTIQTNPKDSILNQKETSNTPHFSETKTEKNLEKSQIPSIFTFDSSFDSFVNDISTDKTDMWHDFANVDKDSAELVISINNAQPDSYIKISDLIVENGGKLVNTISAKGEVIAVVADLPLDLVPSFAGDVQASNLARYIEPNMKYQTQLVPNDPYWNLQWGPQKIEADYAWNTTIGDPSVLVAVIDTGIDWDHPDLAANYVALGYDWVNNDTDPMDDHGHGTHCAGIIAAVLDNEIGIAGLAQVSIMAEKGLDWGGWGYEDDLANAIIHAVDQGADILSNSWGGYEKSALIYEAVKYAYDNDVLVVAAAGNEAWDVKLYPAAYDEVVAVAATDEFDDPAWLTNFGDWVELAAPGVDIFSTDWDDSYISMSGTSMSTPHVSGVAALIWSQFPNKTRDWVRLWLRYTTDDLGEPGFDIYYGYGRINARKAVEETPLDHDVMVLNWQTPPYVEPGGMATINSTIFNFGASDESNVTVQLLVNGSIVDFALIGFLANDTSTTVSFSWSPTVEGAYNVTSYVVPVPGETVIENNVISRYIFVGFPLKVFVLDSAGTDLYTSTWEILNTNWYTFGDTLIHIDYTTLNTDDITYDDIAATGADVLIISCAYDWEFTDSEIDAITHYVLEGHGLIATAGTLYYRVPNNNKLAPLFGLNETLNWGATGTDLLHILNTTHPLFVNIPDPFVTKEGTTAVPSDGRWDSNELVGGTYLALGNYEESAIVAYRGLVYISPWLEVMPAYYHFNLQLLCNAITWSRYQKPEHELIVSLASPAALKPGESTLLNATVSNMGLSNETDVELFLFIDGAEVNSTTIPQLVNGTSSTIRYLWTPTAEATYNVTAYAPPVPGEDNILNNVKSKRVVVSTLVVALFKNMDPWTYPANEEALSFYGIPYFVFRSSDFGAVNLNTFTKVVVASDQDQTFYNAMNTYKWWFEEYVNSGGVLEIHAADWGWHGGGWVGTLPGGLHWVSYYADDVTIVDPTHPAVTTPNPIADAELDGWGISVHGYFGTYPADSRIVIIEDLSGHPAYLEFDYGAGVIVASSQTLEWAYWHRYSLILENSLLYSRIKYEHELAVSLQAPTFLQPSDSSLLNATVYNRGLSNETDVELFLLINGITVDNAIVPELLTGSSFTLSYLWTPTLGGTYNVTAYVPPVPGENVTANNVASVIVTVICFATLSVQPPTSGAAVGETFSINITIANVTDMWGYEFILSYNTSILTATGYASYDPFNMKWAAIIDDAEGVVGMVYSMPFGVPPGEGFSTVEPAPIASIGFTVDATGTSLLDLHDTILTDPVTNEILHEAVGGYFATIVHDIAVTNVTLSKTVVGQGYFMSINVTVANQGDFTETFNVTVYTDQNATIIGDEITIATRNVTLTSRNSTIVTFTWDTTDVPYGDYTISAVATPVPDETDTDDNTLIDGTVLVTIPGDVNSDRTVNILDAGLINAHWYPGPPIGSLGYDPVADINNDGSVNIVDAAVISANWGQFW